MGASQKPHYYVPRGHWGRSEFSKKVKYIIFDDDVSIETVHNDGWPPIPTADMVMNYKNIPHSFDWVSNGRKMTANISGLECDELQQKYKYAKMPNLFDFTGYHNSSVTSFLVRS